MKQKIIKARQHGFTKGSSCLTNLLEFYEAVSDWVDEGKAVDIAYLDFKKAFDKVPHQRLLAKMRACGVAGQIANWIANWLRVRKQTVTVSRRMQVVGYLRDQYSDHYYLLFTSTIWIIG